MTPRARSTVRRSAATLRFGAALCVSALVHIASPLFTSGGVSRISSAPPSPRVLSVRVLPQPEPQVAEALHEPPIADAPAAAERRIARIEREPVARAAPPEAPQQSARPAGSIPEALDLTYYPAKQLDIYPKLLSEIDLKYSGKAADAGVTGRALLLVLIDEIGVVKDVSVVEAEPADSFETDAQRALMAARFAPAYRNGRAVRSRVLIAVNYGVERGSP